MVLQYLKFVILWSFLLILWKFKHHDPLGFTALVLEELAVLNLEKPELLIYSVISLQKWIGSQDSIISLGKS